MTDFIEKFADNQSGISVSVKDCIDLQGTVTSMGSKAFKGSEPAVSDAEVVRKLKSYGCAIVGKSNMHELAFGMTGVNRFTGTPNNPIYPDYIPGGSSSGAATSVANQSVDFAIATDTGGSVRLPAACCGVYGLKPTFGRISRKGVWPKNSSLDCVGVFAQRARMLGLALSMMADGYDTKALPETLTLGLVEVDVNPLIEDEVSRFAHSIDCQHKTVHLPLLQQAFDAGMTIISAESWDAWGHLTSQDLLGDDVEQRLLKSQTIDSEALTQAETVKANFSQQVDQALATCDLLILPTLPDFPLTLKQALAGGQDLNASYLVRPFNLSGHPALSIPLPCEQGPVSVQVIAAKGEDELLCQFAELMAFYSQPEKHDSNHGEHP